MANLYCVVWSRQRKQTYSKPPTYDRLHFGGCRQLLLHGAVPEVPSTCLSRHAPVDQVLILVDGSGQQDTTTKIITQLNFFSFVHETFTFEVLLQLLI